MVGRHGGVNIKIRSTGKGRNKWPYKIPQLVSICGLQPRASLILKDKAVSFPLSTSWSSAFPRFSGFFSSGQENELSNLPDDYQQPHYILSEHGNMVASVTKDKFISEPIGSTEVSLGNVWWLSSYKPHILEDKYQEYPTKTHSNPSKTFKMTEHKFRISIPKKISSLALNFYPPVIIQMSENFTVKNPILLVPTNIFLLDWPLLTLVLWDWVTSVLVTILCWSSSNLWISILTYRIHKQVLCSQYLRGRTNSLYISILWPLVMPDTSRC